MRRRFTLWFVFSTLIAFGACSRSSPTAPTPEVELLGIPFILACGQWSPSVPPVARTVVDAQFPGPAPVSQFVLQTLRLNGGVIKHEFVAGPIVRVEIDLDRLPPLMAAPVGLSRAVTVVNLASKLVTLYVSLDHIPTNEDVTAVQNLGGQVLSRYSFSKIFTVLIEDALVAQVRALPGVASASVGAWICID